MLWCGAWWCTIPGWVRLRGSGWGGTSALPGLGLASGFPKGSPNCGSGRTGAESARVLRGELPSRHLSVFCLAPLVLMAPLQMWPSFLHCLITWHPKLARDAAWVASLTATSPTAVRFFALCMR